MESVKQSGLALSVFFLRRKQMEEKNFQKEEKPLTDEELIELAKSRHPDQSWYNEDFEDMFYEEDEDLEDI